MRYLFNKQIRLCIFAVATYLTQSVDVFCAQEVTDIKSTVQFVTYDESDAIVIKAKRGFATHIKLESDEHITEVAGGDSFGWDLVATKGSNDIFMKPKVAAHNTNLVVATDKRSYTFDLRILNDRSKDTATWRLAFIYPKPAVVPPPLTVAQIEAQNKARIRSLQANKLPKKNTLYSMQIMPKSDEIAPVSAWDDGNFTYLRIPNHREIPTVFRVAADGGESMVNMHMESENKDTVVIHSVARRFVLRLGNQVVGIWNDAYDIDSTNIKNGTVTPGVFRKVVE